MPYTPAAGRLASLTRFYGPGHPKVQEARAEFERQWTSGALDRIEANAYCLDSALRARLFELGQQAEPSKGSH